MAAGTEHHSGTDSYRYIDRLLRGSDRELLIVSPYISDYYAKVLVRQGRNKRIRVITSGNTMGGNRILSGAHAGALRGHFMAVLYLSILDAIVVFLRFAYIAAAITLLLALAVALAFLRARRSGRNLQVKSTGGEFVHEKLYIADNMAITGSANLTYSGTHKNVEHVEVTRDRKEIEALKVHFNTLWKKY